MSILVCLLCPMISGYLCLEKKHLKADSKLCTDEWFLTMGSLTVDQLAELFH